MTHSPTSLSRDPMPLRGRKMLVTGVSRRDGIGHAIACRLAAYGADVFCHHHRAHDAAQPYGADDLDAVMASIAAHLTPGARLEELGADLTETGAPERVIDAAVETFGGLDGLVCNQALSGGDGALGELTEQMLDRHWAVDARASILLAQRFLHHHTPGDDASIVFMTSGQGEGPMPGEIAYAAAKAALAGITATIADEVAETGIRVNTVNPGPVDTGYMTPETWERVASMFPRGRFGRPDDPARLIAWLMTPEAEWITGQILSSEGGFARGRPREG
ncbi:SDR family oxidoreductase [Nesterenkonia xinjiangensis]|uniref:3-oxoacyl-[acyl-carrier protein] reductase n=1 Tax=Nesterenkonia xinjiangensis TaxID=225327 RepID=A0A7Z0K8Z3_9MICC|nr:SDR family oxidoreductase [Nesterenkonia xinjiangensis]NYJ77193.1 3-oxoacyl-[acyl-carrier protein] reductase [Nesterenkonia xinjiangensis]